MKMIEHLADHPLMHENFNYIKLLIENSSSTLLRRIEETGEIRNREKLVIEDYEFYHLEVFRKASAIISGLERLEFAQKFIRSFPCPRTYEKKGITQFSWIEYHYAYYVITFNSFYDMALLLVNTVCQLGNPEENCKPNIIKNNTQIKHSSIKSSLDEIEKIVSPYRNARNLFVHRGELPDIMLITESDTLDMLKLSSTVHQHSDPIVPIETIDIVFKNESKNIVSELQNEINVVFKVINQLFTTLLPIYKLNA